MIHMSAQKGFEQIPPTAVAVYLNGRHVGILHRDETAIKLLHLCGHERLNNDSPNRTQYPVWVEMSVNEALLQTAAIWCKLIFDLHGDGKMPYGFSSYEDFFLENGVINRGCIGLTCATLVLAIFKQAGVKITQRETWPVKRDDDADWWGIPIALTGRQHTDHAAKMEADASGIPLLIIDRC
jgi:hypothetical protein